MDLAEERNWGYSVLFVNDTDTVSLLSICCELKLILALIDSFTDHWWIGRGNESTSMDDSDALLWIELLLDSQIRHCGF